ncbi:MAG: undecaprenyl-diphosphate phosphatase [Alphaproteobacteria bacterium]|nr:undecaprenyl-diphosphate phosphatase [Alphaproteobacteria bacterium]
MSLLHLVVLAMVQGITEFLPISSSGHLVLVPIFTGWQDQGLLLDVAVHVGTLGAVVLYLSTDIWGILVGLIRVMRGRRDPKAILALYIVLATIPVVIAGYLFNKYYPGGIRSILVIGWATLGFGIFLAITDWLGMTVRRMEHIRLSDALIIGVFQILALIPGTSRSGITMSAARLLGFERPDAARFSMLLSIPAIVGAGVLKGLELYETGNAQPTSDALMAGGMAFATALVAIMIMMAWLRRASFAPFVFYRVALGCILLAFGYDLIG